MTNAEILIFALLALIPGYFFVLAFQGLAQKKVTVIHKRYPDLWTKAKAWPAYEQLALKLYRRNRQATGFRAQAMGTVYLLLALAFSFLVGALGFSFFS